MHAAQELRAPEKGDHTRGLHETEGHIAHEEYFTDCLSS